MWEWRYKGNTLFSSDTYSLKVYKVGNCWRKISMKVWYVYQLLHTTYETLDIRQCFLHHTKLKWSVIPALSLQSSARIEKNKAFLTLWKTHSLRESPIKEMNSCCILWEIRAFFPMFFLWFLILFRCALKISSFSGCAFSCSAHLFFLWMRDFVFPNNDPTSNIRGWCGGSFPLSLFFRCLAGPALKLFYLRNAVWNQKPVESTIHAQIVFFFLGNFWMVSSSFMHVAPVSFRNRGNFTLVSLFEKSTQWTQKTPSKLGEYRKKSFWFSTWREHCLGGVPWFGGNLKAFEK